MATATDHWYQLQLNLFPRYNSNYFRSGSDEPRESAFLTTLSGTVEVDLLRRAESTLTGQFGVAHTFVSGVDEDDWNTFAFGLDYEFGRNDLAIAFTHTPRKQSSQELDVGQGIPRKINAVDLEFSRRLGSGWRSEVGYQFVREDFAQSGGGSSDRHKITGEIGYRFHRSFIPSVGFELGQNRNSNIKSSYNFVTPVVRLKSRIGKTVVVKLRYRYRIKDYTTDNPSFSNFDREDRRHDVRLRTRFTLTNRWSSFLYAKYKDSDSTRMFRSYTSTEVGIGISYQFP